MEINQLQYFITIVESDCNLSLAARKIHITQSALSQFISNYERQEDLLLFERKNGRLIQLTSSGQKLYDYALRITQTYAEMKSIVQEEATKQKGSIRIGIPANLINIYFAEFLPQFIQDHPEFVVEIFEDGGNEIKKKLASGELNYGILADPAGLNHDEFEEYFMKAENFKAYLGKNHPLAEKKMLNWSDLSPYPLSTLNHRFMSFDLVSNQLATDAPQAKIQFTSLSWEYLLKISQHSQAICILPTIQNNYLAKENLVEIPFRQSIQLVLLLCRPHKTLYKHAEVVLHKAILDYFYQRPESDGI